MAKEHAEFFTDVQLKAEEEAHKRTEPTGFDPGSGPDECRCDTPKTTLESDRCLGCGKAFEEF